MTVSFREAARRHLADAELLLPAARLSNADQFYGFAAECALKGALAGIGMPVNPQGDPERRAHRLHADVLWPAAVALLGERVGGRWLAILGTDAPFADWSVDQRYAADADAPSPSVVATHADAAARAARMFDAALLDGLE